MTQVTRIIQVSGGQLYNTPSVHCVLSETSKELLPTWCLVLASSCRAHSTLLGLLEVKGVPELIQAEKQRQGDSDKEGGRVSGSPEANSENAVSLLFQVRVLTHRVLAWSMPTRKGSPKRLSPLNRPAPLWVGGKDLGSSIPTLKK